MILLDPTMMAIGVMVVIWATGIPALSIVVPIAAPQRVLVPQVEVRMTPFTPAALMSSAMSCPIFLPLARLVATPAVE